MPICYSALLRRYRTRLRSLVNRFRLHRPESLHFNYRGLAVPYAAFDDLDDWDPELLSGRHFAPEVSLLWHVAQRSHPDGIYWRWRNSAYSPCMWRPKFFHSTGSVRFSPPRAISFRRAGYFNYSICPARPGARIPGTGSLCWPMPGSI